MNKNKPDFSSFFYFNPLPSWVYDLHTFQILDVNQAAIDHYGYSKGEFLGMTINNIRLKQEIPELDELHLNVENREGNIYFGVFSHQKKNGDLIRMKINGHKQDYLAIESMMLVGQDVTEEEHQLKLHQTSEKRLKAASEIAKLGYWRLELDANTLSWTDEVYTIWGEDKNRFKVNFENFFQSIHPDDQEAFKKEQNAAFAGEKELNFIHRIILPDKSIKWVHELGRLVKDENGKKIAFEGTVQDISERKDAEQRLNRISEKLRESESRFRISQEMSPDGFTILHPLRNEEGEIVDFTWVFENQAIADINGTDPNDVLGKRLLELFPTHRDTALFDSYIHVANTGKTKILEEVYVGEIVLVPKWLRLVIVPMGDDIAILTQEITERKLAEEALRESEARFRTIFEIASLGIAQVDPSNGKIILVNSYYESITGYKTDELLKMTFGELTHPDDRKKDWEIFSKAARGEGEYRNEKRYVKKDGTIVWVRIHVAFIRDDNGNPIRTVAICEDITKRKEEEQRLKLLESVITNTNDAVMITEAELIEKPGPKIIYVNKAFTKMTGYTADEVIGKTPRILQGPNSDRTELARLKRAMQNWEDCEITTINYKKNGEEFWINISLSPVANEKGCFTHFIAIERDITELKQKEFEKELLSKINLDFNIEQDLASSTKRLCNSICDFGKFDWVELWMPNLENTEIKLFAYQALTSNAEIFYEWSKKADSFSLAEGLPGIIWQKKSSVLWEDVSKKTGFTRSEAAEKAGIRSVLGMPLFFNQEVVGVLLIGTQQESSYLNKHVNLFEQLKQFIGSEINRKKLVNDLEHLYDAIPDLVCITDLQGRFLKINKAGCELIGCSEFEILYHKFEKFVHPEDQKPSNDDLKKLKKGGKTIGFENRYITKSGEIIWLSWTSNSSLQEGLIYATARNITAEKKLRDLNRLASKLSRIGSWEIDLVRNKLFWSEMLYELHETEPQTFVPDLETAINFYREDFRQRVREEVNKCVETGTPFDFEAVLVTAKKQERWIRAIGEAEMINGKCHRIYGSFQDIHERKEAEVRLRSLADNLPGVALQYMIYPDGTDSVLYVTEGAEQLWGYTAEQVMGKLDLVWHQVKAGGDFDKLRAVMEKAIQSQSKFSTRWRYLMPNGELKTQVNFGTPSLLPDGSVLFNAVIFDITQEAKNEALLTQATEMAKIGSWELDLINQNGDAMYWSPMTREILEVDESYDPSLTGGFEFYKEESKQRIKKAVDTLIHEGKEFDEELLIVTAPGKEKWIRCIGKSERVQDKCIKIYGSFQDIDASKSLEIQIREILGSISDAFYALNSNWEFTYFNMEAEKLLNRSATEVIGKNIWEIFPSVLDTPLEKIYYRVAKDGNPESFEYLRRGDGKWYEVNAYPFNGGVSAYFKDIDERKRAAENLEKAYQEKNSILESIGDAFYAVDRDWIVTYWNKQAEQLVGLKREDIIGKNIWDVYPDAIDMEFGRQYQKAMKTGDTVRFEEFYKYESGLELWLDVSAFPSKEGLSIYFKDITEKKEADKKLLEAYKEKNNILERIGDAFFALDKDWKVTYWNKRAEEIIGISREDLIGYNLWEKFPLAKDLDFFRQYEKAFKKQEPVHFEEYFQPLDQWYEANGYPSPEGISVFFRDITDKKLAEQKVLEANERFEKVTEATNDAIWDYDALNKRLFWGKGFYTLFGYDAEETKPSFDLLISLIHENDREGIIHQVNRYMADPKLKNWFEEYRFLKADGSFAEVIDRAIFIRDSKGKVVRVIGAMNDITERKHFEQQLIDLNDSLKHHAHELELTNEELEQFAFIASHDLQEPLRMITSFLDQLKRKYGDQLDKKALQYIHFATDGARRMKQIILDLLEYSRAGRLAEAIEEVDINQVLAEYKLLRRKVIAEKSVKINCDKLPVVPAYKAALIQTMHCLLDNAMKYSKEGQSPRIDISSEALEDAWKISIADNGIGIDPKFYEKIFIIFQRLHNRDDYDGTGIGLAIVKKHVEFWGGRIWLESTLGKGTVFHFTIPKNQANYL
ncbi:PAS domain S-box protein [Pleomorphovibrio marinus]|uniref:PAS domain S-box protein n=1 Tax=Pleomorphovibrio marinus TaxID=2164132 RepID=UPI000E0C06C0|nr:PAS domain S-box protein [Pleomorphovibrio marinus]